MQVAVMKIKRTPAIRLEPAPHSLRSGTSLAHEPRLTVFDPRSEAEGAPGPGRLVNLQIDEPPLSGSDNRVQSIVDRARVLRKVDSGQSPVL